MEAFHTAQAALVAMLQDTGVPPLVAVATALVVAVGGLVWLLPGRSKRNVPPQVPYYVPIIGSAIEFGVEPVKFLINAYRTYGEVFSIKIVGRTMTYFLTPEANAFFINARHEDVSAEAAYAAITVPVFGKDVVYDVPNHILVEQKKMVKSGLTKEVFEVYVPLIQTEVDNYFRKWGESGEANLLTAFAELTIMTAASCLMGAEIRNVLDVEVAKLYHDLDQGFKPWNFLFPNVPFPANYRRDVAQAKLRNLFLRIINERRAKGNDVQYSDMLDNLMRQEYKNGERLKDHQVAHLMIALLMAGQHTSSTTLAWFGSYLAQHQNWQNAIIDELKSVQGGEVAPLDFGAMDSLPIMDRCLKETLRVSPPLLTLMRKVMKDIEYKNYTIAAGTYVCVSPFATQRLPELYKNPEQFDPDRFLPPREEDVKGGKFSYFPFGAGRHRCIGEQFAYIQIKTIMASFLRLFEIKLTDRGFPEPDYTSMVILPKNPMISYRRRKVAA